MPRNDKPDQSEQGFEMAVAERKADVDRVLLEKVLAKKPVGKRGLANPFSFFFLQNLKSDPKSYRFLLRFHDRNTST